MAFNPVTDESVPMADGGQHVAFFLNDEEYAVDALNVREIIELSTITRIPHLPPFFLGVVNLRGSIIPVVDLKLKFGMRDDSSRRHTSVIVTEFTAGIMGLVVDSVTDVLRIPDDCLMPAPSFGAQIDTEFIKGLGRMGDRLVLVLDMNRVLTDEEKAIQAETMSEDAATA
ncbi:MAG: purine-binding chemotaxis protein CheW [Nitrospirae bacterium]|nr:purine-binding chemotaxis protein CheW [Nitrospirota bacterium]